MVGALLLSSGPGHPAANALAATLSCVALLEGAMLLTNWRGAARAASQRLTRFKASPIGGTRAWDLRMIGAFLVLTALIMVIGAISRL